MKQLWLKVLCHLAKHHPTKSVTLAWVKQRSDSFLVFTELLQFWVQLDLSAVLVMSKLVLQKWSCLFYLYLRLKLLNLV